MLGWNTKFKESLQTLSAFNILLSDSKSLYTSKLLLKQELIVSTSSTLSMITVDQSKHSARVLNLAFPSIKHESKYEKNVQNKVASSLYLFDTNLCKHFSRNA
jgi:hypothetical protein